METPNQFNHLLRGLSYLKEYPLHSDNVNEIFDMSAFVLFPFGEAMPSRRPKPALQKKEQPKQLLELIKIRPSKPPRRDSENETNLKEIQDQKVKFTPNKALEEDKDTSPEPVRPKLRPLDNEAINKINEEFNAGEYEDLLESDVGNPTLVFITSKNKKKRAISAQKPPRSKPHTEAHSTVEKEVEPLSSRLHTWENDNSLKMNAETDYSLKYEMLARPKIHSKTAVRTKASHYKNSLNISEVKLKSNNHSTWNLRTFTNMKTGNWKAEVQKSLLRIKAVSRENAKIPWKEGKEILLQRKALAKAKSVEKLRPENKSLVHYADSRTVKKGHFSIRKPLGDYSDDFEDMNKLQVMNKHKYSQIHSESKPKLPKTSGRSLLPIPRMKL